ncbi:MAG: MMPL family transporter [Actinomycetota bacterium]
MERLGRFCARHRVLVLVLWILVAGAVVAVVAQVGAKTNDDLTLPGTDSQRAFDLLAENFSPQQNGTSPIVFHSASGKVTSGPNEAAIREAYRSIQPAPHVHETTSPFAELGQAQVSDDERTAYINVLMGVYGSDLTVELAEGVLARAQAAARGTGMQVAAGGPIGGTLSSPETGSSDLIGIVAAMLILSLVFGSLVAMGMPILTALFGLTVALGTIGLLGHLVDVPSVAPTLATMIGLGVGIDYALFMVNRHRMQLTDGIELVESVARTDGRSGTAVVFAGGTVVIALVSLLVGGIPLITRLGFASAIAVVTAILAAITLLPALLAITGRHVFSLRIPAFLRPKDKPEDDRAFSRWAHTIARHPVIAVLGSVALLVPLAVPVFSLRLGQEDIASTPKITTERQAYDMISAAFGPGYNGPLLIATQLGTPAEPSERYRSRKHEALGLQRLLERQQVHGEKVQAKLERQGDALLERKDALEAAGARLDVRKQALEAEAAVLAGERDELERRGAGLQAEIANLEARAIALAQQAAGYLERLAVVAALIDRVEEKLQHVTDPDRRARLERRLAKLQQIASRLEGNLERLEPRAERIAARGVRLFERAERLEAEKDRLESRAAVLERQGAALEAQGELLLEQEAELERDGKAFDRRKAKKTATLKALQREATDEEARAKQLKRELTNELTAAAGDPKATDPRLVRLQHAFEDTPGVEVVSPPFLNSDDDVAITSVVPTHAPSDEATAGLVVRMRGHVIPDAISGTDVQASVGGSTASNVDLADEISAKLPLVILVVIGLSFFVLLLAFHSFAIPVQAAVVNLLCVAAAFGVLTATFQWGWGTALIGIDAPTAQVPVASFVPLMMFTVLFGLSMDYQVFLVSVVQEEHERGLDTREAVIRGLGRAGPVIAAAAAIMISVFGSFILNGDPIVKQFGVGLAVAVFLAGTMMLVLAPALLVLMGRATWWMPRWLAWLPRINFEGKRTAPEAPEAPEPSRIFRP